MFELIDRYALVTGGARGIGRGIALALAQQGAHVAINYVTNQERAQATATEITNLGRKTLVIQADVSNHTQVTSMFVQVESQWGQLDILVNNAGIVSSADFGDLTEENWDRVLNTNLKGQFLCSQAAVKLMKSRHFGRIINIASIASGGVGVGFAKLAHYTASKGGVVALTENMAIDLASDGINVNAVAPGVIETDMSSDLLKNDQVKQGLLTRIPKGRVGQPADIGAAVAFLASTEADYITGTVIYVDGGWLANWSDPELALNFAFCMADWYIGDDDRPSNYLAETQK